MAAVTICSDFGAQENIKLKKNRCVLGEGEEFHRGNGCPRTAELGSGKDVGSVPSLRAHPACPVAGGLDRLP